MIFGISPVEIDICVRCNMAFIEPMHHNKPNITYLLMSLGPTAGSRVTSSAVAQESRPCAVARDAVAAGVSHVMELGCRRLLLEDSRSEERN